MFSAFRTLHHYNFPVSLGDTQNLEEFLDILFLEHGGPDSALGHRGDNSGTTLFYLKTGPSRICTMVGWLPN